MRFGLLQFLLLAGSLGLFIYGMKVMSEGLQKVAGQFSTVISPPTAGVPGLDWLADTRVALRAYGATSSPSRGEFFSMGE